MMAKERVMRTKGRTYPDGLSTTTDDCRSLIDVCEVDTRYDYTTDVEDMTVSMARRMSITRILARKSAAWARYSLQKLPIRLTLGSLGVLTVALAIVMPRAFTYIVVYPIFRLVFGTLYPAYASYKAVRTKNVKEYVKWMMYWIVFALFTCAETFTDVFFSFWFPFYYEIKIILVLWLLSPATKGSSILYRRFVHPALIRREAEIDDALARATEQGYTAVLHLGTKGVNYATTVLMQTAIKNLPNALLNPQSTSSPESQSDSAISSLVNRTSPMKSETRTDPVDNTSGHQQSKSGKGTDTNDSPVIVIEPSSDEDSHDHFIFQEDETPIFEDFKAPEKPKKTVRASRRKAKKSLKKDLRYFDTECSDASDA